MSSLGQVPLVSVPCRLDRTAREDCVDGQERRDAMREGEREAVQTVESVQRHRLYRVCTTTDAGWSDCHRERRRRKARPGNERQATHIHTETGRLSRKDSKSWQSEGRGSARKERVRRAESASRRPSGKKKKKTTTSGWLKGQCSGTYRGQLPCPRERDWLSWSTTPTWSLRQSGAVPLPSCWIHFPPDASSLLCLSFNCTKLATV